MTRRIAAPRRDVPFLPKKRIEEEAALLLAEYAEAHSAVTSPPVPIDEIIELQLRLALEFRDMQKEFGVPDVHGALWINERIVGVERDLDPSVRPNKRGRYHFTLAHEGGHWRLHRQHYLENVRQGTLFAAPGKPAYICRSSQAKMPVERQADIFAANLLMPRSMVHAAWDAWRDDARPLALDDIRDPAVARANGCADDEMMELFCQPLAQQFQVSAQAMRIRLEELELLTRKRQNLLF